MKSEANSPAILSIVLGVGGVALASTSTEWFALLAVPIGLAAIWSGGAAFWSMLRRGWSFRGTIMAVFGGFLGLVAAVGTLSAIGEREASHAVWGGRGEPMDRARAFASSLAEYAGSSQPADEFTSNLPIIILHTSGQMISKHEERLVRAQFFDTGNGRASVRAEPDYEGWVLMNLRGSSTLQLPKRSFTFHVVDEQTNQIKVPLLGLPREEDWILYAPFEDKTMIRDVLAYELARDMGYYAPRTRYVELFIDPSPGKLSMRNYAGVYVLMEKIKRGRDRVNIAKLEPEHDSEPEITGGYIVKRDHGDHTERRFHTPHGGPYFYVYPKGKTITAAQRVWLSDYFEAFEKALHGPDFADPEKGYAAYLDVDAFIDAHWLIELGKNVDGFRYSAFLTKDRGGKLRPWPPWDWNRSFGNANYYGGWQPHGWYWSRLRPNEISWHLRLREDPEYARRCAERWKKWRQEVFDPERIGRRIDEWAELLEEAQERNFERWPILGQQVTCNYYVGNSYQEEVRWLKSWIERRIAWIDSQVEGSLGSW